MGRSKSARGRGIVLLLGSCLREMGVIANGKFYMPSAQNTLEYEIDRDGFYCRLLLCSYGCSIFGL